jgi:uncharacterized protein
MNRLEEVRKTVDNILMGQMDLEERRCGFIHLYGVAATSSLLAIKRGLNEELCTIAAMLHDIWSYKTGCYIDHAKLGAIEARRIMEKMNLFNSEEMDIICTAILNHSNKGKIDNHIDELLKDADVLQHYLYNTSFQVNPSEQERLINIAEELGLNINF